MAQRAGLLQFGDLCTTTKFLIQCRKRRWSGAMARRDFRQLGLADSIVQCRGKKTSWLERLDAALDWSALEVIVAGIYASREGGLAYPLLYRSTVVRHRFALMRPWAPGRADRSGPGPASCSRAAR